MVDKADSSGDVLCQVLGRWAVAEYVKCRQWLLLRLILHAVNDIVKAAEG